jgi:beta-N-acetylhexosaminidase
MSLTVGPIICDVQGLELTAEERDILQHPQIGGVILFSRNYHSKQQLTALCKAIHLASKKSLLISVDQEGGRVQRFRDGFTRLPSMGSIGRLYDQSPQDAENLAMISGWIMAAELLEIGVDLSFAPVLDIDRGNNPVVGDRAFHQQIPIIIELAQAFTQGMREAGMAAVGKHFPGHGAVTVDSHMDLPIDNRPFDEIVEQDMVPFIEMIHSSLQGIMAAHIIFPEVDSMPVGFSQRWLQEILRNKLKFSGIIFSDALDMQGASIMGDFCARAQAALEAGCDMALICNNRDGLIKTLDYLPKNFFLTQQKLAMVKGNFTRTVNPLRNSEQWQQQHNHFKKLIDSFEVVV